MNARADEIFRAARAASAQTITGTEKTSAQHIEDVERIAARVKVTRVIGNFAPSLLTPAERWNALPEKSRQILTNAEACGLGRFVPRDSDS